MLPTPSPSRPPPPPPPPPPNPLPTLHLASLAPHLHKRLDSGASTPAECDCTSLATLSHTLASSLAHAALQYLLLAKAQVPQPIPLLAAATQRRRANASSQSPAPASQGARPTKRPPSNLASNSRRGSRESRKQLELLAAVDVLRRQIHHAVQNLARATAPFPATASHHASSSSSSCFFTSSSPSPSSSPLPSPPPRPAPASELRLVLAMGPSLLLPRHLVRIELDRAILHPCHADDAPAADGGDGSVVSEERAATAAAAAGATRNPRGIQKVDGQGPEDATPTSTTATTRYAAKLAQALEQKLVRFLVELASHDDDGEGEEEQEQEGGEDERTGGGRAHTSMRGRGGGAVATSLSATIAPTKTRLLLWAPETFSCPGWTPRRQFNMGPEVGYGGSSGGGGGAGGRRPGNTHDDAAAAAAVVPPGLRSDRQSSEERGADAQREQSDLAVARAAATERGTRAVERSQDAPHAMRTSSSTWGRAEEGRSSNDVVELAKAAPTAVGDRQAYACLGSGDTPSLSPLVLSADTSSTSSSSRTRSATYSGRREVGEGGRGGGGGGGMAMGATSGGMALSEAEVCGGRSMAQQHDKDDAAGGAGSLETSAAPAAVAAPLPAMTPAKPSSIFSRRGAPRGGAHGEQEAQGEGEEGGEEEREQELCRMAEALSPLKKRRPHDVPAAVSRGAGVGVPTTPSAGRSPWAVPAARPLPLPPSSLERDSQEAGVLDSTLAEQKANATAQRDVETTTRTTTICNGGGTETRAAGEGSHLARALARANMARPDGLLARNRLAASRSVATAPSGGAAAAGAAAGFRRRRVVRAGGERGDGGIGGGGGGSATRASRRTTTVSGLRVDFGLEPSALAACRGDVGGRRAAGCYCGCGRCRVGAIDGASLDRRGQRKLYGDGGHDVANGGAMHASDTEEEEEGEQQQQQQQQQQQRWHASETEPEYIWFVCDTVICGLSA